MTVKTGSVKAAELIGKNKFLLLILFAGLLFVLWPSGGSKAPEAASVNYFPLAEMEQELCGTLSKVNGAGKVAVALTLESDMTTVYQQNEKTSESRDAGFQKTTDSQTVIVGSGADAQPVIVQRVYPKFRGALVVCEGAGNPAVRLAIIEAVSALTGLGSDKISVCQMQP